MCIDGELIIHGILMRKREQEAPQHDGRSYSVIGNKEIAHFDKAIFVLIQI